MLDNVCSCALKWKMWSQSLANYEVKNLCFAVKQILSPWQNLLVHTTLLVLVSIACKAFVEIISKGTLFDERRKISKSRNKLQTYLYSNTIRRRGGYFGGQTEWFNFSRNPGREREISISTDGEFHVLKLQLGGVRPRPPFDREIEEKRCRQINTCGTTKFSKQVTKEH